MAAALQVAQHHDAAEVTYVERVGCGVGTQIGRHHLFLQQFFRSRHNLSQHTAPAQFFYEVLSHFSYLFAL